MMGSCVVPVLIGLILLQIYKISECHKIEVTPDPGTEVLFRKKQGQGLDCNVCKDEGLSQTCNSDLDLTEARPTNVTFNCSQPGDVFTVEINQKIDCSSTACSNIAVHPDSTRFLEFSRSFNWDLKVQPNEMFQLNFPAPGMRQIKPSESCPDKHTYTIITYQRSGPNSIGTFCRNGTISRIQALFKGRVSLEVPKDTDLNPSDFKVSRGPDTKVLVVVDVKLPRGLSSTDFFTPHYGKGHYNAGKIQWNFAVEPMQNFTVLFQHYTPPECLNDKVSVDYTLGDKTSFTKGPTDVQPTNKQGDFSLTLSSCEAKANVLGLSLNINVAVFRGGIPYLCTVDLRNEEGLSLQIENKNPESYCEMSLNSVAQERIVVPAGTKADLSFLDCPVQDLQLTATKTIDCPSASSRATSGTSLTIPTLDPSLHVPLHQFTWLLRVLDQGTVDLTSPSQNLHQSVPDKECNERVSLLISETDGSSVGQFCSLPEGTIQKIQIKGNVSITVTPKTIKDLSQEKGPFFKVAMSPEITENVIYTVSPLVSGSMYLPTPNWPDGMNPSSSVTWIVSVPQEHKAELQLTNVSQPVCDSGHTEVAVRPLDPQGRMQSWREDQSFDNTVIQQQSFYLNMSNCDPKSGRFAVLSKVTLHKETKNFLSIILAVVGVLVLLLIITLIVVCVIRKKNKPKTNRSSIFLPRGKPFLPGNATFPKSRADNESHVYASIDDPTMYGQFGDKNQPSEVDNGAWSNGHQVDAYRPFTGPSDSIPSAKDSSAEYSIEGRGGDGDAYQPFLKPPNTFNLQRPRTPLVSQGSLGFEDRRMIDNELHTFKSFGDINPIRLSADESRLQPRMESDTDSNTEPEYEEAI
ncbi:CUB domain-containing protein 1 [Rhinichthys klamathensis goyatoka]|uniref:CUB domain-containing protein 1 n=1 Tax=Rhinichthys klamathensis goyatoka TaxID=3034132 RepID=UPI0024B52F59|nr:CUB domain-containing protein 1 [Rhinichthys klamathensis goyatoka]